MAEADKIPRYIIDRPGTVIPVHGNDVVYLNGRRVELPRDIEVSVRLTTVRTSVVVSPSAPGPGIGPVEIFPVRFPVATAIPNLPTGQVLPTPEACACSFITGNDMDNAKLVSLLPDVPVNHILNSLGEVHLVASSSVLSIPTATITRAAASSNHEPSHLA